MNLFLAPIYLADCYKLFRTDAFRYDWARLRWLTVNAMKSSFLPFRERLQIIEQIIKPRYAPLEAWQVEPPL